MADITLSKAVRSNLLNLQNTAAMMGKTQERMSTGLKVNSALDNPTNFFTASGLNSRASDLGLLLDSVSNAVQTIAAADKGISAITKLVESAQATARQAQQISETVPGTTTVTQASATGTVNIAADTQAAALGSVAIGADSEATTLGSVAIAADSAAVNAGSGVTLTGATTLDSLGFADGDTISITTESGGTTTFNVTAAATQDVDALLTALGANDGLASIELDGDGNLVATAANNTDTITFGTTGTGTAAGLGLTTDAAGPTNAAIGALTGTLTIGDNTLTFGSGGIETRAGLEEALSNLTGGVTGSVNSSGFIELTGSGGESFTVGGTVDSATAFGIDAGDYDATNAAIGALSGTLTIGANTLTFGSGGIETRAGLEEALGNLTGGVTGSVNSSGFIELTGSGSESFTVGGTIDASTAFGLTEQDYDASNSSLSSLDGTLTIGGNTLTFGEGGIQTRADLETALGSLTGGITGSVSSGGALSFTGSNGASFTVGGTIDAAAAFGVAEQAYSSTSTIDTSSGTSTNPKRAELRAQFDELLSQIDQLAKDSGFNGVNLLGGDDLSVLFNEDGGSKLDIDGVTFNSQNLGLGSVAADAFSTNGGINSVLDSLKGAIDTLRVQASKFGSNLSIVETRQDFTKNMINVLETGAANLTLADTNEEAANLLALQTRQQLSSTALSLASQADQNVLRLF